MIEQKNRLKKVDKSKLFFPVTVSPMRAIIENEMLKPRDYVVLHHGKNFMGVKPKDEDKPSVFYIENKPLYEAGATLASSISSGMTGTICFTNQRLNKSYFLFEENSIFLEEAPETDNSDVSDIPTLQKLHSFGFSPTIIVENGFDYNDKTMFYLLIGLEDKDSLRGFLTIAKFRLSGKTVDEICNGGNKEQLILDEIKRKCVPKFQEGLSEFVRNYEELQKIKADRDMLTAVALDVFNRNRNIEALKSDTNLLREIHSFRNRAYNAFSGSKDASKLLNFIVNYKSLNLRNPYVSSFNFREILTEKKAYTNSERLFTEKNIDTAERMKYIEEQIRVMNLIPG